MGHVLRRITSVLMGLNDAIKELPIHGTYVLGKIEKER
jgi:hypothetical protein